MPCSPARRLSPSPVAVSPTVPRTTAPPNRRLLSPSPYLQPRLRPRRPIPLNPRQPRNRPFSRQPRYRSQVLRLLPRLSPLRQSHRPPRRRCHRPQLPLPLRFRPRLIPPHRSHLRPTHPFRLQRPCLVPRRLLPPRHQASRPPPSLPRPRRQRSFPRTRQGRLARRLLCRPTLPRRHRRRCLRPRRPHLRRRKHPRRCLQPRRLHPSHRLRRPCPNRRDHPSPPRWAPTSAIARPTSRSIFRRTVRSVRPTSWHRENPSLSCSTQRGDRTVAPRCGA